VTVGRGRSDPVGEETAADGLQIVERGGALHVVSVPGGDERTRSCVNHSLALLLIELAHQL